MGKDLQEQDLFDKYFKNTLTAGEKQKFQLDLENDPELHSRFELFKDLVMGIQAAGQKEIKSFISEIDSELQDPNFFFLRIKKYASVAAVLIILVGFASYFTFFNYQINTLSLFSQYYNPYENDLIYYSRGVIIPDELQEIELEEYNKIVRGMKLYDSKDYENAYLILNKSYKDGIDNLYIMFYLAMNQISTNRDVEAINSLKFIIKDNEHPYYDDALWYISLAYLKIGNIRKSKKNLRKLARIENNLYSIEAAELLKQIKSK